MKFKEFLNLLVELCERMFIHQRSVYNNKAKMVVPDTIKNK